jgi:anti-repressor protein
MEDLIKITENDGIQTVSGRELHRILGIETAYTMWFTRMCEYGFKEDEDYLTILVDRSDGLPGKPATDHIIKLDMAKEICMIQRTDIGRKIRQYFISAEKQWRALKAGNDSYMIDDPIERANRWIEEQQAHQEEIKALESQVAVKDQQIAKLQPKASYYDIVLSSPSLISVSQIAKDYGWSATKLNKFLNNLGIQYKLGNIWLLYQKYAEEGYTGTKTHANLSPDGSIHTSVHTYWTQKGRLFIYDRLKEHGIYPLIELPEYEFGGIWS